MDDRITPRQSSGLTNAAFTLALISIAACTLLYLSIPFGSMAIILALLGRGSEKLSHRGKLAVLIGISTIVISVCTTTFTAMKIYKDPQLRAQFNAAMEYYTHYYMGVPEGGDAA